MTRTKKHGSSRSASRTGSGDRHSRKPEKKVSKKKKHISSRSTSRSRSVRHTSRNVRKSKSKNLIGQGQVQGHLQGQPQDHHLGHIPDLTKESRKQNVINRG